MKPNTVKIIQIIHFENDQEYHRVLGLGDDERVYIWETRGNGEPDSPAILGWYVFKK